MFLDYSKIKSGHAEQPVLRLRTLAGKELGTIPWAYNVRFEINYTELSKIEFDVPSHTDGKKNPAYALLTGYKVVYTETYGIYLLTRPTVFGDGISEVKHITGYSLEWMFEKKSLFLEEGTYNFWNPVHPEDTILGRIAELDPTWEVGYVDPKLIGCYRTFDEYHSDPLSFAYGTAMEKYNCAIVFDVYQRTINAYDASKSRGTLPIYLSYQNLVDAVNVEELADDMVTKLKLYGSDGLSIRSVNPTGKDYIIDLSWFLANGDLDLKLPGSDTTLADRVRQWNAVIKSRQEYYTGLIAARASRSAQKLVESVQLTTLNGELDNLTVQQSVTIQAIALEKTESGKAAQQANLDTINGQIQAKKQEISQQEGVIAALEAEIESYTTEIRAVNDQVAFERFFSEAEQRVLTQYLIEGEVSEETFVATDVDSSVGGTSIPVSGFLSLDESSIVKTTLDGAELYVISGGVFDLVGIDLSANVVQGTLEIQDSGNYLLTAYLGTISYNGSVYPSGMVTLSGTLSQLSSDIAAVTEDEITEYRGNRISFQTVGGKMFFTANVSEYQKYAVEKELYSFGEEIMAEKAWPVYEFSIGSANFLFQEEFEPFKNRLELGKAVRLNLGNGEIIEPNLIGISFEFENRDNFSLTFSNRFQKTNAVKTVFDSYNKSTSSSRSFDASKYLYNRVADKTEQVSKFMEGNLDAAVNKIIGASNQSVKIDGAGIQVGGDSLRQLRIVDSMIAMTDDGWKTAKVGVGEFYNADTKKTHWGINTELIAGKLIVGNNLILENKADNGVMQFKVDSTGAWLNNSTFVLQKDNGGRMILDPKYGLMAGSNLLFTTDGTTVKPSFLDKNGALLLDDDGMPKNTNFFLDIRDGSAYFRGSVYADDGVFKGKVYASDGEFKGKVYATDGEFKGKVYASDGIFTGTIHANSGDFTGTIKASRLEGDLTGNGGWLEGSGIRVGKVGSSYNFLVDAAGNVKLNGNIDMSGATSLKWAGPKYQYSSDNINWHSTQQAGDLYRRESYDGGTTWGTGYQFIGKNGEDGADGKDGLNGRDGSDANVPSYVQLKGLDFTNITGGYIQSPKIYGGEFYGTEFNVSSDGQNGSFNLFGDFSGRNYHMFKIDYYGGDYPVVSIYSPCSAEMTFGNRNLPYVSTFYDNVTFMNGVNFRGAVTGITAVFA